MSCDFNMAIIIFMDKEPVENLVNKINYVRLYNYMYVSHQHLKLFG